MKYLLILLSTAGCAQLDKVQENYIFYVEKVNECFITPAFLVRVGRMDAINFACDGLSLDHPQNGFPGVSPDALIERVYE